MASVVNVLDKSGLSELVTKIKDYITEKLNGKATVLGTEDRSLKQVLIDNGDGDLAGSGVTIGGGTFQASTSDSTLATEAGVENILYTEINTVNASIDGVKEDVTTLTETVNGLDIPDLEPISTDYIDGLFA